VEVERDLHGSRGVGGHEQIIIINRARGTPPKRPKLEIGIDEKRWENLRDRLVQTLVHS
jgi:hypothetical protein